jgi:AcrR family transcriptional regulator
LLGAAQELFGQKGFEPTTTREIGERAGVDAALIARYFGSKADLYIAALTAESIDDQLPATYERLDQIVASVIGRIDRNGLGPIMQALIRADTSDEIGAAARAHLTRRVIDPLIAAMHDQGIARADLRAQLAISALIGIGLGRTLGWFDELNTAPAEVVVDLTATALGELTTGQ